MSKINRLIHKHSAKIAQAAIELPTRRREPEIPFDKIHAGTIEIMGHKQFPNPSGNERATFMRKINSIFTRAQKIQQPREEILRTLQGNLSISRRAAEKLFVDYLETGLELANDVEHKITGLHK
jgi:hypothetical protein